MLIECERELRAQGVFDFVREVLEFGAGFCGLKHAAGLRVGFSDNNIGYYDLDERKIGFRNLFCFPPLDEYFSAACLQERRQWAKSRTAEVLLHELRHAWQHENGMLEHTFLRNYGSFADEPYYYCVWNGAGGRQRFIYGYPYGRPHPYVWRLEDGDCPERDFAKIVGARKPFCRGEYSKVIMLPEEVDAGDFTKLAWAEFRRRNGLEGA